MVLLFRLAVALSIIQCVISCLPNPFFGYSPGYGGYYSPPASPYGFGGFPRVGPFRSEAQRGPSAGGAAAVAQNPVQPRFAAQEDEIRSISSLNCAIFSNECKWSNTREEELDWTTVAESPQSNSFLQTIDVQNFPDQFAAALVSTSRKGWEGGQLVSDALKCITNGLKLTATVWKSKVGSNTEQPKLQVCSKNLNEEKFPLINCNDIEIRNGVPMSVDIPAPDNPTLPAKIVLNGYNFIAPEGGALFVQDIVIEGSIKCNGEVFESHPVLITNSMSRANDNEKRSFQDSLGPVKSMTGLSGLEAINAIPVSFEEPGEKMTMVSNLQRSLQENSIAEPKVIEVQPIVSEVPITTVPSLFENCLALSCNPSDLSCKFWRSAGNNRWEIGVAGRVANPLTGIALPPGTAQKFLVAPFFDSHISSYTLVSEQLNVPLLEEVYFCFYEYYATEGLSISVCTDKMDCFYKKNALVVGEGLQENKKWNIRCAKLPPGTFELRVIAENSGENKGEVGFLPIRLARDPLGKQLIC